MSLATAKKLRMVTRLSIILSLAVCATADEPLGVDHARDAKSVVESTAEFMITAIKLMSSGPIKEIAIGKDSNQSLVVAIYDESKRVSVLRGEKGRWKKLGITEEITQSPRLALV